MVEKILYTMLLFIISSSQSLDPMLPLPTASRRMALRWGFGAGLGTSFLNIGISPALTISVPSVELGPSLASRLAKRDAKELTKATFNVRPDEQVYPPEFLGEWDTTVSFAGYEFPTYENLPKSELVRDVTVAGFQKLSIAMLVDVGRPTTNFVSRWVREDSSSGGKVVEDKAFNLKNEINAALVPPQQTPPLTPTEGPRTSRVAVDRVDYVGRQDPNRCSVVFNEGATRNAERIELFTNARSSEVYSPNQTPTDDLSGKVFLASESIRQVTFSASRDPGVARQVVTEYQYFWTHRFVTRDLIRSNLLTCAYLEPNDPNFFKAVNKPVAVYSHNIEYRRRMEPSS